MTASHPIDTSGPGISSSNEDAIRAIERLPAKAQITDDRIRESLAPVVVWGYLILIAFLCLTAVGFGYIQNKSPIPDLMEILKIGALPVVSFVLGRFFK